jgi:hypothetical protein
VSGGSGGTFGEERSSKTTIGHSLEQKLDAGRSSLALLLLSPLHTLHVSARLCHVVIRSNTLARPIVRSSRRSFRLFFRRPTPITSVTIAQSISTRRHRASSPRTCQDACVTRLSASLIPGNNDFGHIETAAGSPRKDSPGPHPQCSRQ